MKKMFRLNRVKIKDKRIIRNLANAFRENDRMRVLLGEKSQDFYKKIVHIISYSYFMVKKTNGLFISKNQSTYLLFYTKSRFYFTWRDMINYLHLAFRVIGICRVPKVYQREQRVTMTRGKEIQKNGDKDYLYVWFLAQTKETKCLKGLMEAKNFIVNRAKELKMPIYMETTEKRLVDIYSRIGFQFYDCIEEQDSNLRIWFGRYQYA